MIVFRCKSWGSIIVAVMKAHRKLQKLSLPSRHRRVDADIEIENRFSIKNAFGRWLRRALRPDTQKTRFIVPGDSHRSVQNQSAPKTKFNIPGKCVCTSVCAYDVRSISQLNYHFEANLWANSIKKHSSSRPPSVDTTDSLYFRMRKG